MDGVQTWHASITIAFTLTLTGTVTVILHRMFGVSSMMKAL